jgi:methylglutamate dehydrogenase subunit D
VPEFTLAPSSAALLVARGITGRPGVTIGECTSVSLCSVLARKGAEALLADRVRLAFGVALPQTPRHANLGVIAFAWAGPSHWLAMADGMDARTFEMQLRSSFAGAASVIDQSDALTIVRIGGPRARDALAKGILIDLHPSAFGPGDAAVTTCDHIGVHFWQCDATPLYEFAVLRSFAIAFWEWIGASAAEFGFAVEEC